MYLVAGEATHSDHQDHDDGEDAVLEPVAGAEEHGLQLPCGRAMSSHVSAAAGIDLMVQRFDCAQARTRSLIWILRGIEGRWWVEAVKGLLGLGLGVAVAAEADQDEHDQGS